ncbi:MULTISPECIES: fructose-6-phosphate aldolase [Lacticaseibacillus]|uniref:Probable transaldolase n=2 Tax=Lacticaseibacillus TaxID=2759736 RepID=A0AAN1C6A8_LACCA|nr:MULTISPECIES: fructose-6-phosphate aldolase [Lacticaseibacillus]ARY90575.1 fructose-6-phosphate aldolase [Lacticaseibacillus casei]KAB1970432.1 fructose-6-phosphate aldolase [Lacticaseibacillus casei]WLV81191.1 fructose-6-phosphate aldolase [Lacticaseibacillus sp. NCIMB 15473]WNX25151.1 fructose-6-phosphate aldolase [Lacticaseibacillus casei]WNX27922.1 fructose-6-phosphate aldolase [Lacticaseibacillus casei]
MKFFLDTADVKAIKQIEKLGLVDGVTTNPTIISREGRDFEEVIREISQIVNGPISAEVTALDPKNMVEEAEKMAKWSDNVVIKLPMTESGLLATHYLSQEGIKTNVTLVFSVTQGLMAAKSGATFVSPFVGRLDDIAVNGMELVSKLRQIFDRYEFTTEIIAASIRNREHVEQAALSRAHIATIPPQLFKSLWYHPLTDQGVAQFTKDWEKFKQNRG